MSMFVESPWPSLVLGVVLQLILAVILVRTGRATVIAWMVGVLAITAGLLVVERIVVTETEEVEDALDSVARALVANDTPAVLALFSPTSTRRGEVQSVLSRVTIREAKIGGDLEIRLNRLTSPPSATTYFTGRIDAKDTRGTIPYEHVIRKFKVTLHREGGRWLLFDYADADVRNSQGPRSNK
jgi:hypothetical protein